MILDEHVFKGILQKLNLLCSNSESPKSSYDFKTIIILIEMKLTTILSTTTVVYLLSITAIIGTVKYFKFPRRERLVGSNAELDNRQIGLITGKIVYYCISKFIYANYKR